MLDRRFADVTIELMASHNLVAAKVRDLAANVEPAGYRVRYANREIPGPDGSCCVMVRVDQIWCIEILATRLRVIEAAYPVEDQPERKE